VSAAAAIRRAVTEAKADMRSPYGADTLPRRAAGGCPGSGCGVRQRPAGRTHTLSTPWRSCAENITPVTC
jgi:hypothetical protein